MQKLETVTGISVLFSELSRVSGDCGYDVGTEWKLGDNDVRRAEDGAGGRGSACPAGRQPRTLGKRKSFDDVHSEDDSMRRII